jgi:hypothetical protein
MSAFFDEELSSDQRMAVVDHLACCDGCARELEGFRGLSVIAGGLAAGPQAPGDIWQRIDEQLDLVRVSKTQGGLRAWRGWTRKPIVRVGLAMAAAILIAAGWLGYANWFKHGADHQMDAVFGEYLAKFTHDPLAAQQVLLANYESHPVSADEAVHTVGYHPVVADGLPEGYSVTSTCVMRMPCCDCVQSLCLRSDGTTIAIFEHEVEEPEWFGDRQPTEKMCGGKPCSLFNMDDRLAATWRRGKRQITLVGVRDSQELERLVAWFDNRGGAG